MGTPADATIEAFFDGDDVGLGLCRRVIALVEENGPVEVRVSRSQVAMRRKRGFAFVWRPGNYVSSKIPAVLSIASRNKIDSPRFKEVVQPSRSTWMHHLELPSLAELDDEVRRWLQRAYDEAGP